jgi:hypothetical protein
MGQAFDGATKKPPGGRLDERVGDHALYEMTMMRKRCVDIGTHSTGFGRDRQTRPRIERRAGDKPVHDDVYGTWMTREILGIGEKFRG